MIGATFKISKEADNKVLTWVDRAYRHEVAIARARRGDPRHWKVGDGYVTGSYNQKLQKGDYNESPRKSDNP